MTRATPTLDASLQRRALLVALLYAAFAALWIMLSDMLLAWWLPDGKLRTQVGLFKGWLFVGVTAILLYVLLYRSTAPPPEATLRDPPTARNVVPYWAVGLLIATIAGLTALTLVQRHTQALEAIQRHLHDAARNRAEQMAEWHRERLEDAALIAQTRVVREDWDRWATNVHDPTLADALRQRLLVPLSTSRYTLAGVADAQGHAVWTAPAGLDMASTPPLQALVSQALTGRARHAAWRDDLGTWHWWYAAPLDGVEHPAVLLLRVARPQLLGALRPSALADSRDEQYVLARRDGNHVWLITWDEAVGPAIEAARPDDRSATVRQLLSVGDGGSGPDTPFVAAAQPVAGTDWWLVALLPRVHIWQEALRGSHATLLAALLAIFATVVGTYLFAQRLRLQQIQAHALQLQSIQAQLADSEARYRLLAEHAVDVVWLFDLDRAVFAYVSPSVERLLGRPAQTLIGQSYDGLLTPASLAQVKNRLPQRLAEWCRGDARAQTETTELDLIHADGRVIPTETASTLITDADGRPRQIQGVTRDLSARREAEAHIRRLSQVVEQSPAAVLITDAQARIEYVNPAFERISGYTLEQIRGQNPRILSSGRVASETWAQAWRALRAGLSWSGEVINRRPDGSEYLQAVTIAPVVDHGGNVTHYVSVQLDLTAQRDAEDKAYQLAWFDPLTSLPNRASALEGLQQAMASDASQHRCRAVLLLNVDRFKTINEALGHASGDQLLLHVANRLRTATAPGDLLARLGSDEFACVPQNGHGDALAASRAGQALADAMLASLAEPFTLGTATSGSINITASIGIAIAPSGPGDTPLDALRRADTALRRAKELGGARSVFFDDAMGTAVARRFAIEQELRHALVGDELRLYLQPQVGADGRWRSAEALVRWQHPTRGLVPPAEFVPVAEGCDLIEPLGAWVLRTTCAHLGHLARNGLRFSIAVNVSPRQFHRPQFVEEVLSALASHGGRATDLVLEVTESVVVEDVDAVIDRMLALTRHGVRFSLDDFGTGYSSLSYLKRLPIHELKIDRSFVQDVTTNPEDAALVEAIIAVAERMHLQVVAEGVETAEQAAYFARWPHVLQQGYWHGRPDAAEAVLARWACTVEPPISEPNPP